MPAGRDERRGAADESGFDAARARPFKAQEKFVKTAILLVPAEATPIVLRTPFGDQTMRGPFYLVAEEEGSYGASQAEFEASHERTGPHEWRKVAPVLAYQVDQRQEVATVVGGRTEATVVAEPGDWIVRHRSGEVTVVKPGPFAARYTDDTPDAE